MDMTSRVRFLRCVRLVVALGALRIAPFMAAPAFAQGTYTYEFFRWMPQNERGVDGDRSWLGEFNGHQGEYQYTSHTEIYEDFGWASLGEMLGSVPPVPWYTTGTVTYPTSWRVVMTEFTWLTPGTEDGWNWETVIPALSTREYADAHALYLSNYPVPEPSTLFLVGLGIRAVNTTRKRARWVVERQID